MDLAVSDVAHFLASVHPYDSLDREDLDSVADKFEAYDYGRGDEIYKVGQVLPGLFLVHDGAVEVRDARGGQVSLLGARNSFGERGLTRDGVAVTTAVAVEATKLLVLPTSAFRALMESHEGFAKFFTRTHTEEKRAPNLATMPVSTLLTGPPITCGSDTTILEAARLMRARNISSLAVVDMGLLAGIVTTSDLSNRALAEGLDTSRPVSQIMTPDPVTLRSNSLGTDVLHIMHERGIGHLPIVDGTELRGMVTQTDLTRLQAVTSAQFVSDIARARSAAGLAKVTAQIPQLLVQLVGAGNRHEVVTRLITDIADAVTRRLLKLAEAKLGPAPVPYLWLACGSQGRREQTGVSDQDNCLILDERVTEDDLRYFDQLAAFVTTGLDACGYVFCPGDMMATNPRWRQPLSVWRSYFDDWIATPKPEAQMLASVMFDLRPIGGRESLFTDLQAETLEKASKNSIFVSHMIANSLKHAPPLGMLRGFATIRSGEYKNQLDLKHSGVVPVVDLGRVYALQGRLSAVNTRARLEEARDHGVLSKTGASDLLDAYDLIAQTRLEHQAKQVRQGGKPNNFMAPTDLSDFERSHLRDAFVVIRTLQSAIGHGRGMLG
ncbi:MAG: DUF294 nucleotidyltransferase-like domain-containing protein [Rhodobacteraceae bacterium]|nr:DUF294 nucleotidyltransferase-like domain-containing protein [Paracoccaceae bacterium]